MSNKRQNIFNRCMSVILFILLVALMIGILGHNKFFGFNSKNDICEMWQLNFDEHQILTNDEYETYLELHHPFIYDTNNGNIQWHCSEWHKKTKCELIPNDAKNCVCDEWKDTDKLIRGYPCPNSCRNITIQNCIIKGFNSYGHKLELEGRYNFDSCEMINPIDKITSVENFSMVIFDENIANCEQCYEYKQTCIKSHKSSECEKGNFEYIEKETLKTVYFDDGVGITYNESAIANVIIDGNKIYEEGGKICQKKILSDLNCGELKDEYFKKENDYCPRGQFWFICFGRWRDSRYGSKEEILMEYMRRCLNGRF